MTIINEKLIQQATLIAKPSIEVLLEVPEMTWGPKYVEVCILIDSGKDIDQFTFTFGEKVEWDDNWGKANIQNLAKEKALVSMREKDNTSSIFLNSPWRFNADEHFWYGGIYYAGISIGVSGAHEEVDQHIAEMILFQIMLLARMKAKNLKKSQEWLEKPQLQTACSCMRFFDNIPTTKPRGKSPLAFSFLNIVLQYY